MEDSKKCLTKFCTKRAAKGRIYCSRECKESDRHQEGPNQDILVDGNPWFSTRDVLKILNISKSDLYTIMRPVRSQGKILPPIFTPEVGVKLVSNWVFTSRDIEKMRRYFDALKEYKTARGELKKPYSDEIY
jgi:hypothetical protein